MITNDQIQSALVTYTKSRANITSALGNSVEIREDQWQGQDFSYPNIRIRIISNASLGNTKECHLANVRVSWMVFSESPNSKEADKIAGVIYNEFYGKQFRYDGILFYCQGLDLIPAMRIDERTWRSEAIFEVTVNM